MAVQAITKESAKEKISILCQLEGKELLKFEGSLGTYYAAIKDGDNVYALVIRFKAMEDGQHIQGLHENELPNYHDASLDLLSLLTPTTNKNAIVWRKRTAIKE